MGRRGPSVLARSALRAQSCASRTRPAPAGEIYPSYVNVPSAGSWRLALHWAGHVDQIDLRYIR
jgi:hypothetical protein